MVDREGMVRYVGISKNIRHRTSQHMNEFGRRVSKVVKNGLHKDVRVVILEKVSPRRYKQCKFLDERMWIARLRGDGHPLINRSTKEEGLLLEVYRANAYSWRVSGYRLRRLFSYRS